MKLGLLGKDIGHSLSPDLFGKRVEPLNGNYSLCSCDSLKDVSGYLMQDYDGFNVTMPYKSSIMDLLDALDPEAEVLVRHLPFFLKGHCTFVLTPLRTHAHCVGRYLYFLALRRNVRSLK